MIADTPPADSSARHRTTFLLFFFCALLPIAVLAADGQTLFQDDFESGLGRWETYGDGAFTIVEARAAGHGHVLRLSPRGDAYALIRESAEWGGIAIEGRFLFPTDENSYLGVVYNFERRGRRTDFGLIYIKSPTHYLQVNTHRDFNVGRTLYPERRVDLSPAARFATGQWQRFRVERIGDTCHFYVGDDPRPQLTFGGLDLVRGAVGLEPRSVGGDVWVDDIVVHALAEFTYQGPPVPDVHYAPDRLLTDWQVYGPLPRTDDAAARGTSTASWREFPTDRRGAVLTGRVVDYHGPDTVAYFRTKVDAARARSAVLHLATVDDLALWVNGRFHWFIARGERAWYDFHVDSQHAGRRIPINLRKGENEIVLRVRGGVYASGGFYAAIEDAATD